MPAHLIDLKDYPSVLRILLSLVVEAKGELRFKAQTYDALDRGRLLTLDFDKRKSQVIIRSTSDFASAVSVAPEAHQWSQPANLAPRERARLDAEIAAQRGTMRTDEELAEMEERMVRNQRTADDLQEGRSPTRISIRK